MSLHSDLSSGTSQVKMSTLHIAWIAIIIAVDVHDPQRVKTIDFDDHAALDTKYLLI